MPQQEYVVVVLDFALLPLQQMQASLVPELQVMTEHHYRILKSGLSDLEQGETMTQYLVAFCAPLVVIGIWTAVAILADIRKMLRDSRS